MTPHFGSFTAGEGEQRRNRIEQALQDMAEVVNGNDFGVLTSNDQTFTSIYNKYFPPQYKNAIKQIFKNIAGTGIQDRSTGDSLQQINFNDIDSQSLCTDVSAYVLADRDNPPTIDQLVIHFCSSNGKDMYQYPDLSQITCDKLDDFVSWKMLSLGGYALLHEVSHAFTVSHDALNVQNDYEGKSSFSHPDQEIADFQYGPKMTRQLLQSKKISGYQSKAAANADSVAWFANARIVLHEKMQKAKLWRSERQSILSARSLPTCTPSGSRLRPYSIETPELHTPVVAIFDSELELR
ncbi:MAG: hypothetical protein Q9157_007891 [Trypethelium eluteriae]